MKGGRGGAAGGMIRKLLPGVVKSLPGAANGSLRQGARAALLVSLIAAAEAQSFRILNAASLSGDSVAPESIVTLFGTRFATGVAVTSDAANPPVTLNGVSVTVGGVAARLFYAGPTQINAVLSRDTPVGRQPAVVTSQLGAQSATVVVDRGASPGLFSLLGSGTRDGAILDAVSFAIGAFAVRTGGGPTHLSIFATGLASNITPLVTFGGVPVEVTFFGNAPCCLGLQQINVVLSDSLSGAGRVPVIARSGNATSNAVEIVLLPGAGQGPQPSGGDTHSRSRELASLAWIPRTSLALLADENDDVVRVIDVTARQVRRVIALREDSEPVALAVNEAGTRAMAALRNRSRVAVIDLTTWKVLGEVTVGQGPVAVAIAGEVGVVANGDEDTVSLVNLTSRTLIKTLAAGDAPRGVTANPATGRAYAVNQGSGTVTVVDLASTSVIRTLPLGPGVRAQAIQLVPGTPVAVITDPGNGPDGSVVLLNLESGAVKSVAAHPDRSGGSGDIAVHGRTVFVASQTGGSVTLLRLTPEGDFAGGITNLKVDLGARSLAVDTTDNLLLVTNQGSGTIVLVDLTTFRIVARFSGLRSGDDDDDDDHGDRDDAANAPAITSLAPAGARANTTFQLTVTGTNLSAAEELEFLFPGGNRGNGKGSGNGQGKGPSRGEDPGFAVTNLSVNADGTRLTATVRLAAGTAPGARLVRVETPNGESTLTLSPANTFTVQ